MTVFATSDKAFRKAPAFYNARGQLTAYGLACGYLEKRGAFTLYHEGACYHVRGFRDGVRVWETARTLTQARRLLSRLARGKAVQS